MNRNFLKTFNILVSICLILFITGCGVDINLDPYKDGKTPENNFTLNSFLNNNMILQQNKNFSLKGISEKGVILTATIFDQDGDVVSQTITIAGENGEFELKISGIQGGNTRYRLEVSDGVHTQKFRNIMFGEVWLVAGEISLIDEYVVEEDDANLDNIKFVKFNEEKLTWYDYEDTTVVSNYIKAFATYLNVKLNMPIAIIDASFEQCYADAWLSKKIASNYSTIKKHLETIDRYRTSNTIPLNENQLGSMYKTYIESINEFELSGVIWNQGVTDFKHYNLKNGGTFVTNYSYILLQIFTEFNNTFDNIDIYSIQDTCEDSFFGNALRNAQAIPSYQLNNVELITTYDCFEIVGNEEDVVLDEETEEDENDNVEEVKPEYVFSINKYVNRLCETVYQVSYNNNFEYLSPAFNEVLTSDNIIKISFSCSKLDSSINDLYGLKVMNDNEELDYDCKIVNNSVVITLKLSANENINDLNIKITYGYDKNMHLCNLKSLSGIPIIPFEIKIN